MNDVKNIKEKLNIAVNFGVILFVSYLKNGCLILLKIVKIEIDAAAVLVDNFIIFCLIGFDILIVINLFSVFIIK